MNTLCLDCKVWVWVKVALIFGQVLLALFTFTFHFHSHKLQHWSVSVWNSISSFQSSPLMDSTADFRVGCGVCGKKVAPGYLFRHHQRYHTKMAKKFPCNSCLKEYYSGARLEDHIKGKHQDIQPSLLLWSLPEDFFNRKWNIWTQDLHAPNVLGLLAVYQVW